MPWRSRAARSDEADAARQAERRAALLADYRPLVGIHDEMMRPDGSLRPHWESFLSEWTCFSDVERARRFALIDRHLADSGVSYRIRSDDEAAGTASAERPWPISHLPLPIAAADWRSIQAGVIQRVRLLEAVLADIYGPGDLVASGALPALAVAGSPDYLRPMHGLAPPGGSHLKLYAVDLGRSPSGEWWVLGDRAQAPSGAGYALENRLALARAVPDAFARLHVERLAGFFRQFRAGLVAGAERADPRICVWTPGPLNETYFEQAYLARYLGFLLVEGSDLVMRDDRVHIRTIAGLKRADVLWRRVDGDFADPLELNPTSQLGVAGLVQAVRAHGVLMANALGAGVIEAPALMSFLPALCRRVLGEELRLPNVATWWCGQPVERQIVLDRFEDMAIAPAFRTALPGFDATAPVIVAELGRAERERLRRVVTEHGAACVGQEVVHLSTMPVLQGEGLAQGQAASLAPRPFSLRVYAAHTPQGWQVMPGGFGRISDRLDARAITMRDGARSCDVWVMSDEPVAQISLLPEPTEVAIRRLAVNLPSRVADNLFWLGRYLERAEAVLRLVRALLSRQGESVDPLDGEVEVNRRLARMLVASGAAPASAGLGIALVRAALHDAAQIASAAASLSQARRTASVSRERLSMDSWRIIVDIDKDLSPPGTLAPDQLLETAERALRGIAAFAGLVHENMNRGPGWRFLELGRRIERALTTCRFARQFADELAPGDSLDVLLDLIDSQITYRARYVAGLARAPVLDMAIHDDLNPRSVAFQVNRIVQEVTALPALDEGGRIEPPGRLAVTLNALVQTGQAEDLDRSAIIAIEQALMTLSDAIASRYFLQTGIDPAKPTRRFA